MNTREQEKKAQVVGIELRRSFTKESMMCETKANRFFSNKTYSNKIYF